MKDKETPGFTAAEKLPYETPRLTRQGSIEELTQITHNPRPSNDGTANYS